MAIIGFILYFKVVGSIVGSTLTLLKSEVNVLIEVFKSLFWQFDKAFSKEYAKSSFDVISKTST